MAKGKEHRTRCQTKWLPPRHLKEQLQTGVWCATQRQSRKGEALKQQDGAPLELGQQRVEGELRHCLTHELCLLLTGSPPNLWYGEQA